MNGERGASFDSVNAWRASVEWRVEYIVYELKYTKQYRALLHRLRYVLDAAHSEDLARRVIKARPRRRRKKEKRH